MGIFLVYILKSAVCLAVFYLFYKILLSRETFHRFNRFALLGVLVLSALIPLAEISVDKPVPVQETMFTLEQLLMLADMEGSQGEVMPAQSATVLWIQVALWVYLAGICFFAVRNLWALVRLLALLRSGKLEPMPAYLSDRKKRATLVVHECDIAPFSWMRYIVISRKDLEESGREILIHELAHIRNGHSWDVLLADLCIFVQWFNPAAWLLKQELQNIHEYEADETVLREGVDARGYQMLLIKKAVGARLYSIANSLNHSSLKKRITMMMRKKSNPWARAKYLYVLPLAAVAVVAFARPEISKPLAEISKVKVNDLAAIVEENPVKSVETEDSVAKVKVSGKDEEKKPASTQRVFMVVENMPEFPGGMKACMEFLAKNIKYPAECQKKGIQGRVVVQFIVKADGSVDSPTIMRSVDPLLDAEALRVVGLMPKWKPGTEGGKAVNVKFTIPVSFKVSADDSEHTTTGSVKFGVKNEKNILVIVDGVAIEGGMSELEKIDPETIESVEVIKDQNRLPEYNAQGKEGVILINTKKNNK